MPTSVEGVGLPLEELNAPLQVAPIADEAIEAIEREKQEVIRSEQQRTVTQERTAEQRAAHARGSSCQDRCVHRNPPTGHRWPLGRRAKAHESDR